MAGAISWDRVRSIRSVMRGGDQDLTMFPDSIKHLLEHGDWKDYTDPTGKRWTYGDDEFAKFVTAKPEAGLGANEGLLRDLCRRDIDALNMLNEAIKGELKKPGAPIGSRNNPKGIGGKSHKTVDEKDIDKRDNITFNKDSDRGTSTTYALRKLSKDAPAIHAEVLQGELSPHAGMIKAGYRKRTITLPEDPEDMALAIVRRLSEEDLGVVISILVQGR